MFGSGNISPDYTFTQSENRLFTPTHTSKTASKTFEDVDVSEETPIEKFKEEESPYPGLIGKKAADKEKASDVTNPLGKKKDKNPVEGLESQVKEVINPDDDEDVDGLYDYGKTSSSITTSFEALAAALGSSQNRVTKEQLVAYLDTLSSKKAKGVDFSRDIAFVKNLIAKFDTLSDGQNYITSFSGIDEPQDYKTITKEQVTPPIDIRI